MPRLIVPFEQMHDDASDSLIEGKLHFFDSGTNTPKDTFKDVNNEFENTNPVQLTAAGRVPNIFGEGSYKVILTDKDDVQIQVFDPVSSAAVGEPFGAWAAPRSYAKFEFVRGDDECQYMSIENDNEGNEPSASPLFWTRVDFVFTYNANQTFKSLEIVLFNLKLYVSLEDDNKGNTPSSSPVQWFGLGDILGGDLNANGFKIINLGNATDAGDAVNLALATSIALYF